MKKKHYLIAPVLFFSSTLSLNIAAEGYLGLSLGLASPEDSDFEGDTASKISGGYKLKSNFAIEASYINLGSFEVKDGPLELLNNAFNASINLADFGLFPGDTATITNADIEISGFELASVGILPVNENFALFGRVGIFIWDADISTTVRVDFFSGGSASDTGKVSDDGTDVSIGIGGNFKIAENFTLTLEANRYAALDADVDYFGIGFNYFFQER